jgi:hypothetical protein
MSGEAAFEQLADAVQDALDMEKLDAIVGVERQEAS